MRCQRFICIRLSDPHMTCFATPFHHSVHHRGLSTEAAYGCLKSSPTGRLRRAFLYLSYSMTLARLLDTTCHTTGHAGPHPAVRQVKLSVSREFGKSERREESVRESDVQRWGVARCHGPSELPAVCAASCAATPRLRSSRYLVVPRFHCFQTIDRSRRRIHCPSSSSTLGVSHRPK